MMNYKTKLRLNNYKSINNLMARAINSFVDETITEEQARTIGYLANILYKGIEQAERLDLDIEEQKARIEHTKAKTSNTKGMSDDVQYLGDIAKLVYGEDYNILKEVK